MQLSTFISPEHVLLDIVVPSKLKLLRDLSKMACQSVSLLETVVFNALYNREKLGSTGIGGGIALPHCRLAGLEKPFGIFVRLRKPLDFESVDEVAVDIVFLLLMPDRSDTDHLNVLAGIARLLRSTRVHEKLKGVTDAQNAYALLVGPTEPTMI